jgi:hypothetical protein
MALLCFVIFIFRFTSLTMYLFSELYVIVMLFCIAQKFVAGLYSFLCCTCACVVSDCLPDFGTDVQYKQRLYPC